MSAEDNQNTEKANKKGSKIAKWLIGGVLAAGATGVKCISDADQQAHILNGPRFGGVTITDKNDNEIPERQLQNNDIKYFLIDLLEKAKKYDKNSLLTEEVTTRSTAFFDWEASNKDRSVFINKNTSFIANVDSAIHLIQQNKFEKALGDVEDALVYVPKAKIDAEHLEYASDTIDVQKAAEQVAPPLEKARKVLEYLVASQGKRINNSEGQSRGQQ